ncbi:MAG: hypothetical protein ABIO79_16185 [Ferruginibacter sp.]
MKKYLLLITFLLGGLYVSSQDLDNIKKLILLQQYEKAKPEIDTYLADAKNTGKAEAWYYKAYVYYSLGRVETKPLAESQTLLQGAFDAIKKYTELDTKLALTTEEKNGTVYNIYYSYYDLGVKAYNAKSFPESYELFKRSLEVHDYIYGKNLLAANNLKFSLHDTDVVWNLAVLANELKKKDDALVYYTKIADANLGDEKYAVAYDELILKYKKEKNAALFTKYLAAARKHYPVDKPYWDGQEIDFSVNGLENEALLTKYEELTQKLPDNYIVFYNYAIEIDKFLGSDASKGKDIAAYRKKTEDLFKKAITIKSTVEANLQLANMNYDKSFDLQEQIAKIKGSNASEVKLRNELIAQRKLTMAETIPYAEAAIKQLAALTEYKFADKANYKLAIEILINAYKLGGNTAKVAELEKQKLLVDKL